MAILGILRLLDCVKRLKSALVTAKGVMFQNFKVDGLAMLSGFFRK